MLRRFDRGSWLDHPWSRRRAGALGSPEDREAVREIVGRVGREGDAALLEYSERFDGWRPGEAADLRVGAAELAAARSRLRPSELAAIEFAAGRIRAFHSEQRYEPSAGLPGLKLLTRPVRRAGVYVPGGRAAYPSTVLMCAIPAAVAGVREVALCSPPLPDGSLPPAVLAAAEVAGIAEVYRVGGAHAIAALALGTVTIPAVDVVVGPGSRYVTLAKREVFGAVGIDSLAGPSEVVIVADASTVHLAGYLASDLAAQMEHDPDAIGILFTESPVLADAVMDEFTALLPSLERREIVDAARGAVVVTETVEQAVQLADEFAPEHLELVMQDGSGWVGRIENAGAIFLGPHAPVALGDYVAGPNHTLPTSGAARFSGPLGVHTFLKRCSVAELTRGDLERLEEPARALANLEGLQGHARSLEVRVDA